MLQFKLKIIPLRRKGRSVNIVTRLPAGRSRNSRPTPIEARIYPLFSVPITASEAYTSVSYNWYLEQLLFPAVKGRAEKMVPNRSLLPKIMNPWRYSSNLPYVFMASGLNILTFISMCVSSDICLTVYHWYKWYKHQLDATITVY
jgi:hypothetical protein